MYTMKQHTAQYTQCTQCTQYTHYTLCTQYTQRAHYTQYTPYNIKGTVQTNNIHCTILAMRCMDSPRKQPQ